MTVAPLLIWAIAAIMLAGVAVVALFALGARALFAAIVSFAAIAAGASGVLALLGEGDAALALAVFGVGVGPVLLLGAALLTARAAKPTSVLTRWFGLGVAAALAALMAFLTPELSLPAPTHSDTAGPPALWLAVLLFVAVTGAAALLGYGARGILGGDAERER